MASGPLQQLQAAGTVLIADTADFEKIARFQASEGTTNPSLLYAAAQNSAYSSLISRSVSHAKSLPSSVSATERLSTAVDFLAVQFGTQIYKLTGKQEGVPKEQLRIKISATWEGIQAARILQSEHGVSCLITVVFGLVQAIAAAEAGVDAIAPYVGRIADWGTLHGAEEDLGVATVSKIQNYLRKHGFKTKVMAASFRNVGQVRDLAGVDLLTAAPAILEAVEKETEPIVAKLTTKSAQESDLPEVSYINDESAFRWAFNADACAVEKSADAMKKFGDDTEKLKALLAALLA
ncbi:transaldolase [Ilyonectria robusta]